MPPLRDTDVIDRIRAAYCERTSGGVRWRRIPAAEWVLRNLGQDDFSTDDIDDLVYEHIVDNGTILVAEEKREEYLHHKYHYDFHIVLPGVNKKLYVETTLAESRMGPVITVVNAHWAD